MGPHSQLSSLLKVMSSLWQRIQLGPHCHSSLFSHLLEGIVGKPPKYMSTFQLLETVHMDIYDKGELSLRGGEKVISAMIQVVPQCSLVCAVGEGDTGRVGHAASGACHEVAGIQAAWLSIWGRGVAGVRCHVDPQLSCSPVWCTEESCGTRRRGQ